MWKKLIFSKNFLAIFLIFFVSFFVWRKTLFQTFLGEGYFYFEYWRHFISPTIGLRILFSYDNFARLMFTIVPEIFRDNFFLYQFFQLLICSILYSSVYWVVYKITNNRLVGLIAAILFASNFIGNFEMIADGNYDRFVQRIPNFIPAIFSLYFLDQYLSNYKQKYLTFSAVLYAIGLFLAHITIMILPLFIVYPFIDLINKTKNKKTIAKAFLSSIIFFLITFAQVFPDPYHQNKSFLNFLLNEKNLIEKLLYQLVSTSLPFKFIEMVAKNFWPFEKLTNPYIPLVQIFSSIILSLYLIGIRITYRVNKNIFKLYLSVFLSLWGGLILYFYSDDKLNPFVEIGAGRQYFLFVMYSAILHSILLFVCLPTKIYKTISIVFVFLFVIYNSGYINKFISALDYKHEADRKYLNHLKALSPQFTKDTIILTHSPIRWPNYLVLRLYAPKGARQATSLSELIDLKPKSKSDIFVFDYDFGLDPKEEPNPNKGKLIDLTNEFREGKVDLSSW